MKALSGGRGFLTTAIMNKNTNYTAPTAAEAKLKALQHLNALASKGATSGNL